jgi:hypothetical protein
MLSLREEGVFVGKMRHSNYLRAIAALLFINWFSECSANSLDDRGLILAAQSVYYNLPNQGVTELQCSVTPDWATMLSEELKSEIKPDNAALKLLNRIHFWVAVSENGETKLTHQVDANPESTSDMDNFQKAINGIEETMDGFWKTASVFLLTSPLPRPEASYQLSEAERKHVISYREGSYAIVTTLAEDYTVSEIKVTSATLSSSLKPRFTNPTRDSF